MVSSDSGAGPDARAESRYLVIVAIALVAASAVAQPVIVEDGWLLRRSIAFNNPVSAHYNPVDGHIYMGQRGATDGLFRIDRFGVVEQISDGSDTAGICVDPTSGDVFQSEDYGGVIYRTALGELGREAWVSEFHSGDDDPVGMAIAPLDYAGDVLAPGEALVVDRGNANPDEIWIWSPTSPGSEVLLHADDGTLVNAVDVAIDGTRVFVVDSGAGDPGQIYAVGAGGALTPLATSEALHEPVAMVFDPTNGDLLVLESAGGRVVRIDPTSGLVSDVITGLSTGYGWACLGIAPDGYGLLVAERDADLIHEFVRCDDHGPGFLDCNNNGIHDPCDIASGVASDCNANGVPDLCDIDAGTSDDCNLDGIPDECPNCPPIELVFIMDTSASMDGEAAALCASMAYIISRLESLDLAVEPRLLGICDTPGGAYDCLEDHVVNLLGAAVPGSPPPGLEVLGDCPGGNQICTEDWGLATAVVAGLYPWQPVGESVRLVIPLFDEGAWCGDPIDEMDAGAVAHASAVAASSGVIVSPITGSGSSAAVVAEAEAIAQATGGRSISSSVPDDDIAQAVIDLVLDACTTYSDCNLNGILDECDIASGTSLDENGNGIPDECEAVGVGDVPSRRESLRVTVQPNPFNPRTTLAFEVARGDHARLRIHDQRGRLVATLLDGLIDAGRCEVVWTGRDDDGRELSSGVYLYRLEVGDQRSSGRLTLLR